MKSTSLFALVSVMHLSLLAASPAAAAIVYEWASGFHDPIPGVDAPVYASVVFDDGSGPALYAGGHFTMAGGISANFIAKWNGLTWAALGSGMNATVSALTVFDDGGGPGLYAGGAFTTAGGVSASGIAKWNGANWSPLGSGLGNVVAALAVFDDGSGPALYAGGYFTNAGEVNANFIAKWDGANWSALSSGTDGPVRALTVFDDGGGPALYAGGQFSIAGGVSTDYIAKWDGANWSALGSGKDSYVLALTVFDDGGGPGLFAGGLFSTAGGVSASYIAKWNGAEWSALSSGVSDYVQSLTVFDDGGGPGLYASGPFTIAGGVSANGIAKWDGANWSALGSGLNGFAFALSVFDDGGGPGLFAGGLFPTAGGVGVNDIAKWDGVAWSGIGPGGNGMDSGVLALAAGDIGTGPALYAGGFFSTAGGVSVNGIAQWNGSTWSALGSGMNNITGAVHALAVFDDGGGPALYAGGDFTTAGGVSANRIAKWNGSTWSALGSGMNDVVLALAVFDDGGGPALYAGGFFATAGGVSANNVAKWDGANWSPLGTGTDGNVHALIVFDDGSGPALYAGGGFSTAGGVSAQNIAKWDGSTWSPLGSGINGNQIYALAVFDDGGGLDLFVGGTFHTAGGVSVYGIAQWNGVNWSPVGSTLGGQVNALEVFDEGGGPALYAGGYFPGNGLSTIARWTGANWSALGSGTNNVIWALGVFDDGGGGPALYAGGSFTMAGGQLSTNIAKWQNRPCGIDSECIDSLFCNGAETCDLGLGLCVTTFPCTAPTPTCDEIADTCTGCATTGCPDDGLFCNGTEFCNFTSGLCLHSGFFCPPNQVCDEETDQCLDYGACCLHMGTVCFETFQPDCVDLPPNGAGGIFLGAGSHCPQQNAVAVPEGGGTVFIHVIGPPVDCPAPGPARAAAACLPGGPYTDAWVSDESAGLCHNFGSPDTDPIPAGFFDDFSNSFTSTVCLRGVSLNHPDFGDADTLIERLADPFDRCDLPSGTSSTVSIEIVALSLESVAPITVTYSDGSPQTTWNVTVDLSPGGLPPSTPPRTLTATKSHCNGGTYTSVLYVQPRFTFTKVGDPSEVRVLDTGIMGTPPVELVQSDPHPWVSDLNPFLGAMVDLCSDFHANISENNPLLECDCNVNEIRDKCDADADADLVPNECDNCPTAANPLQEDFDNDGIGDHCDPPDAVIPDPSADKTRSISLTVPSAVATGSPNQTAVKITMMDLQNPIPPNNNPVGPCCPPGNFTTFDTAMNSVCAGGDDQGYRCPPSTCPGGSCPGPVGCSEAFFAGPPQQGSCARWVGPPLGYLESNDSPALGNYRVARLQCTPYYHDWSVEGIVNVIGAEIVPSSIYEVEVYSYACKGEEDACIAVSDPVIMTTRRAGDITTPFQGGPPLTQPNAIDVTNAVNKFRNLAGSPPKVISQVQPNFPDPNSDINAIDIVTVVDNQRGFGYTYSGPCTCPSTVPCNTTACAGASACTGLYGAGATCIKTCTSGPRTGHPCNNNLNCGACIGGPASGNGAVGIPCDANTDCVSNNCGLGICPTGATPGFCRDRCGRCN